MDEGKLNVLRFINFHSNYLELPKWVNEKVKTVINFCDRHDCRVIHSDIVTVRPPPSSHHGPRPIKVVGFVLRYVGPEPVPEILHQYGYRYPGDTAIVNHKLSFEINILDEWPDVNPPLVMDNLSLDDIMTQVSDQQQITSFVRLRMGPTGLGSQEAGPGPGPALTDRSPDPAQAQADPDSHVQSGEIQPSPDLSD